MWPGIRHALADKALGSDCARRFKRLVVLAQLAKRLKLADWWIVVA